MTVLNNGIAEDIQIIEARKDIERSGTQIGMLETLDRDSFPCGVIDNLIGFHKLRIQNCQKALKKTLHSKNSGGKKWHIERLRLP